MGERAGRGRSRTDVAIRVSSVARLEEASFSHAGVGSFEQATVTARRSEPCRERAWMERAYGDFWQHMLVAEGRLDFALEASVNLWDLAAVQLIVEEAGGRFTDFAGVARPDGGSGLSSNGLLHDEVLAALGVAGASGRGATLRAEPGTNSAHTPGTNPPHPRAPRALPS